MGRRGFQIGGVVNPLLVARAKAANMEHSGPTLSDYLHRKGRPSMAEFQQKISEKEKTHSLAKWEEEQEKAKEFRELLDAERKKKKHKKDKKDKSKKRKRSDSDESDSDSDHKRKHKDKKDKKKSKKHKKDKKEKHHKVASSPVRLSEFFKETLAETTESIDTRSTSNSEVSQSSDSNKKEP